MVFETSEAVSYAKTVAPGANEELVYQTDGAATIERLKVRFYPGQQLDLKVRVVIRAKGSGQTRNVVQMQGDQRFDGDDDTYTFELSKPIRDDEELVVQAENVDPDFAYDFRVNAEVDYRAGTVNALYKGIKGVFN